MTGLRHSGVRVETVLALYPSFSEQRSYGQFLELYLALIEVVGGILLQKALNIRLFMFGCCRRDSFLSSNFTPKNTSSIRFFGY